MMIKLEKVISVSSEHPDHPASNLLNSKEKSGWRTAQNGALMAYVIFQLSESSTITGLDIENYRSCVVIVAASTTSEPDNWVQIINHQFLTHDEAENNKFRDQVQLFAKKNLNPDSLKMKFDRVKVSCMQNANHRTLFGLSSLILRTETTIDIGEDIFGRFKLKASNETKVESWKEKKMRLMNTKQETSYKDDLKEKMKADAMSNFAKRQDENQEPPKRPLLDKLEAGKADEVFKNNDKKKDSEPSQEAKDNDSLTSKPDAKPVARTPFGDVVKTPEQKKKPERKRSLSPENQPSTSKRKCAVCEDLPHGKLCSKCKEQQKATSDEDQIKKRKLQPAPAKPTKDFSKLFEDVVFALSGYVNPQRDNIRRKALQMGASYNANPNTTSNKCTHLICAFKNTPKSQQLKGHAKIVSHKFIEECFDKKKR